MKKNILLLTGCLVFAVCSCSSPEKKLAKELKAGCYDSVSSYLQSDGNPNVMVNDVSLLYFLVLNSLNDQAVKAIEKGADVNWVRSMSETDIPIFELVIQNKNVMLEKAILQHNLNLETYGLRYFDKITNAYFYKDISKDFVDEFLSFDYVTTYLKSKDKDNTLCILAWNWTDDTPEFYNKIYGENFKHSVDIPVLIYTTAWGNIEGTKFFIDKGFSPFIQYADPYTGEKFTALEHAVFSKDMMTSHHGSPDCFTEDDEEVKNQNKLIAYLKTLK